MITLERWKILSLREQLGHITAEIKRAKLIKSKDENLYLQILERIFYLIGLSLNDSKWQKNPLPLLVLQNEIAKAYLGKEDLEEIEKAL